MNKKTITIIEAEIQCWKDFKKAANACQLYNFNKRQLHDYIDLGWEKEYSLKGIEEEVKRS